MDTQLKSDIIKSGSEAQYDECCKQLLSNKQVLAWILKYSAVEYKDCTLEEIINYIEGEPQISSVAVDAGETAESIKGLNTEDSVINEGKITYDLRFEAVAPGTDDEAIQLIINVEAQNAFKPNYPLLKRAVYYCSRMISAQKGLEFFKSEYNKIKKVYSIWICTNPPKDYIDTVTRYKISEENVIGKVREAEQNYDLMNIVMICLGNEENSANNVLGLLETLLSASMNAERKIEVLDKSFNLKMSDDMETEVLGMCNLSEGVFNKGWEAGIEKGIEKGMESTWLVSIKNLIHTANVSAEQAMEMLMVPVDKRKEYAKKLETLKS